MRQEGDPGVMLKISHLALAAFVFATLDVRAEAPATGGLSSEMAVLANEVDLAAWVQIAAAGEIASLDEAWVTVYSPMDPVGAARSWGEQVAQARTISASTHDAREKRWLELFIAAGTAIDRHDAHAFSAALRAVVKEQPLARAELFAVGQNFFAAK